MDQANALCRLWEEHGAPYKPETWPPQGDRTSAHGSTEVPSTVAAEPVTIEHAVETFLRDKENQNIANGTLKKYRSLLRERGVRAGWKPEQHAPALIDFCREHGYVYLTQLELEQISDFRNSWKDAANTAQKNLERLRDFFRYCVERDWTPRNPAQSRSLRVITRQEEKEPFAPEEFARIIQACSLYTDDRWGNLGDNARELCAMVLVLRFSGLRISDATVLEKSALALSPDGKGWSLHVFQKKVNRWVYIPVPEDVVEALRELKSKGNRYFFWTGNGKASTATNNWRARLDAVFTLAETKTEPRQPFTHHPHPHRFRHTFAAEHLLSGMDIRDVSILLGHKSVSVTEKHYAKFNTRAQAKLDESARRSLELQQARNRRLKIVAGINR